MSDLVGNPEDRFSRVAAQINEGRQLLSAVLVYYSASILTRLKKILTGTFSNNNNKNKIQPVSLKLAV